MVDDFFDRGYMAALVRAKDQASVILDTISEGIIAHDLNRRIFYFNRAAEQIPGLLCRVLPDKADSIADQ